MFKNKALLAISIVVFVDLLGFSIILPLLPYYAITFKASPQTIGYLVATYSVCQFIAAPILGGLSDRLGRRPLLIYSQLGSFAGFLLLGFANSLPILFLSRIIDGLSGGNLTIAQAYIADVTSPQERAGAMGVIGIAFGLGFIIGSPIGGFSAQYFGYSAPAFIAALFALSSTMLSIFFLKEHQHIKNPDARSGLSYYTRIFDYFRDSNLRRLYLIFLFFALPFSMYVSMFSLFAKLEFNYTPANVGLFLMFVGLLGVVWQGAAIRPLIKKIGELDTLRIGMACLTLGMLGLVFAKTTYELAGVAVIFSFGTGISRPTLSSMISQIAPQNKKGGALGVSSSLESASRSVAPILGGWIIGGLHPSYIGYAGAILGSIGTALALTVRFDSHEFAGGAMPGDTGRKV